MLLGYYLVLPPRAGSVSSGIVISQIYGGGGNSGATYKNDFIELFNRGTTTINVTGWSVQYASSTGTTWQVTNLSGSIGAGKYYLIQEAAGGGGTANLPASDATGSINMAATAGKVALVNNTTALSGACPSSASIIDLAGFGSTANCFEGSGPTPAPSNTNAVLRAANGCTDTDNNALDFSAAAANPRNSASPAISCGTNAPIAPTCPSSLSTTAGTATGGGVSATDPDGTVTSALITNITPSNPGTISLTGFTAAGAVGGTASATLQVSNATPVGNYSVTITWSNNDSTPQTADCTVAVAVAPATTGIVVSQVYGGGGNSGATFKNDFIELFNRGTATVTIT
ncbi:MAG TPA: lamin tail domain-containing protein, partial [Blastocatellia bacterium]